MTTGTLARRAGVGVETIRFYEREGLLPAPPRRESGYRIYADADLRRVQFLRRAQELGFTLREASDLLALRLDEASDRADVRARASAKIADLERRIADLERMRTTLAALRDACHGHGTTEGCPILGALDVPA